MIGTIRKHQNWLWIIIITVTIVTFVGFLSPTSNISKGGPSYDFGTINGEPISAKQFGQAKVEEALWFYLNYRDWPKQEDRLRQMGYDLEQRTYQRLLINAKVKEMNIEVSDDAVVRMTKTMFGLDQNQSMPMDKYHELMRSFAQGGVTEDDFQRYVRHQVGQQQLIAVFGMSGKLITPKEAEAFYRRENQPISAEVVRFNSTNFLSQVTVTPKAIEEYYTNNQAAYRLPERVQVNYIKFDATNYLAEVDKEFNAITNLNERINSIYLKEGVDSFKDENGKQLSEADAKAKLKQQMRQAQAVTIAKKKTVEFLTELYNKSTDDKPFELSSLTDLAKAKGLVVSTTEPFDLQKGPSLNVPKEFAQRAFRLADDPTDKSKKSLFSASPIASEDAVYAIALKQRIPSQVQPLAAVRTQVTADYRKNQAMELAMVAGERFDASVTNGLAAGKSFEAICAEAKVKPTTLAPFSLATKAPADMDKNEFEQVQSVAYPLPTGKASGFIPSGDGGFMLYVKARLPVDESKLKTELPSYVNRMREQRQTAAFGEWFQKQAQELRRPQPASAKSRG